MADTSGATPPPPGGGMDAKTYATVSGVVIGFAHTLIGGYIWMKLIGGPLLLARGYDSWYYYYLLWMFFPIASIVVALASIFYGGRLLPDGIKWDNLF